MPTIFGKFEGNGSMVGWRWAWKRELRDRYRVKLSDLLEIIDRITLKQNMVETWRWKHDRSGKFTTSSAYKVVRGVSQESLEEVQNSLSKEFWVGSFLLKHQRWLGISFGMDYPRRLHYSGEIFSFLHSSQSALYVMKNWNILSICL